MKSGVPGYARPREVAAQGNCGPRFSPDRIPNCSSTMAGAVSDTVATKADIAGLEVRIADPKAAVFRVLWIQGAGLVGIQLAIAGVLFAAI